MPRSPRADEAGGLYHALNRGNLRAEIFHKWEDYVAFERILYEALEIHKIELYSYLLMPNHYHIVLRPLVDGVPTFREVESSVKVPDDNTEDIAARFRDWLKEQL